MPHILVAGRIHEDGLRCLREAAGFTFHVVEDGSDTAYLPFLPTADALLLRTQKLDASRIASANSLKIVSRHGVGYDAVDVEALNGRGIPLTIVGDVNSRAVAEHTLMLMLAAARRVVAHDTATRAGQWGVRNRFETVELDGKTLLIIGFGRIGRRVAHLAQAFGMEVVAYDPFTDQEQMKAAGVRRAASIDGALPYADYVSLHVPGSPSGPMFGADELALMKPGAILVNAARGGLIDETALDVAIREGRLGGAALDVFTQEPPPPDHPFLTNDRIVVSPHAAGLTNECASRMAVAAVRNIVNFYGGTLEPALVVNAKAINFS